MLSSLEVLKKYWNFDSFRSIQLEIIEAVLSGKDTFGIMPTGGGKSICFQLPALMSDGICIVVSPLIALMKDQVANLQKKGIKAIALTGGISSDETIDLLDNCEFGNYKFLYLSPERLQSDWILERLKNLKVNLIAIDEAHCVSQWGHDFRPAYLKIAVLKDFFPNIPFIALTASATNRVQDDVVVQLKLSNPLIFKKSFSRANLAYMVFEVEDKLFRISQILRKNPESSIIYVRNRKSCLDVSQQLTTLGIQTTYYHGGLSHKEKDTNMQLWLTDVKQVIVATNAFGMGIDKSNVKTVIHIQLPENIENYYQEAGRAGRNGEKAFAILLVSPSDSIQSEKQFLASLPEVSYVKEVYIKLCNYFQIAYGEGINEQFLFNLNHFCGKYSFPVVKTYNAIQFLDRQSILTLSQEFSNKISLKFIISSKEVIRFMSLHPQYESIILTILRSYPGIYELQTAINTDFVAKKTNLTNDQIIQALTFLKQQEIVEFLEKSNDSKLIFNDVREDEKTINRVTKFLNNQNQLKRNQFQSVLYYINQKNQCKNKLILEYFGEISTQDCGICSYCVYKLKPKKVNSNLSEKILKLLKINEMDSREIEKITKSTSEEVIFAIQGLLESKKIIIQNNNLYRIIH